MARAALNWEEVKRLSTAIEERIRAGEVKSIEDLEEELYDKIVQHIKKRIADILEGRIEGVRSIGIRDNSVIAFVMVDSVYWEGIEELCSSGISDIDEGLSEEELDKLFEECINDQVKEVEEEWGGELSAEIRTKDRVIKVDRFTEDNRVHIRLMVSVEIQQKGIWEEAVLKPYDIAEEIAELVELGIRL